MVNSVAEWKHPSGSHMAAFWVRTDPRQLDCNRHREGI